MITFTCSDMKGPPFHVQGPGEARAALLPSVSYTHFPAVKRKRLRVWENGPVRIASVIGGSDDGPGCRSQSNPKSINASYVYRTFRNYPKHSSNKDGALRRQRTVYPKPIKQGPVLQGNECEFRSLRDHAFSSRNFKLEAKRNPER